MKCPYCEQTKQNEAGLSAHVRHMHPDKWKGTLRESLPVTYNLVKSKGYKKPKIHNKCLWCKYTSDHPPGLARHIKCTHPTHWKGNLGSSLGREPSRAWKKEDMDERRYRLKLADQARYRARNIAKGLTAGGKPRKQQLRKSYLARHGVDALIANMKPRRIVTRHKIKPIVYPLPGDPGDTTVTSSLKEDIINRVAEKIAERLLE